MIASDQPTCFGSNVTVAVSSVQDGTMLNRLEGIHTEEALRNRQRFCNSNGIAYDDVVYQRINYSNTSSYTLIKQVSRHDTTLGAADVVADALISSTTGIGILLPLADCIGLVLFCPASRTLAVLHMGRHSSLTNLITDVLGRMKQGGADMQQVVAWMTPSARKQSYRMQYFDQKDDPRWSPFCDERAEGVYLDLVGYN